MKITIMYDFLKEVGGLERVMFFQANLLAKTNQVKLFFSHIARGQKVTELLNLDRRVKLSRMDKSNNEFFNLTKAFLRPGLYLDKNSDLIISHSYMTTRMAAANKKKNDIPFITMIHHPPNFLYASSNVHWANNPSRLFAKLLGLIFSDTIKRLDIAAVKEANLVIVNSEYTKRRVKEIYGLDSIVVYPPIAESFRMVDNATKKEFIKSKKIKIPYILAHGRIIPDKRYIDMLTVLEKIPEVMLIITGTIEEDYRLRIEKEARIRNISDRLKIVGKVSGEDLLLYYNCARVFVMPAHKEDFGLTVVEAQACGCPVVAWDDAAGPSEIVKNGTGILVNPYNLDSFIQATDAAIKTKWDNKKISRNALGRFSQKVIGKQFLQIVNSSF